MSETMRVIPPNAGMGQLEAILSIVTDKDALEKRIASLKAAENTANEAIKQSQTIADTVKRDKLRLETAQKKLLEDQQVLSTEQEAVKKQNADIADKYKTLHKEQETFYEERDRIKGEITITQRNVNKLEETYKDKLEELAGREKSIVNKEALINKWLKAVKDLPSLGIK